ncbi:MAG TPA: hypothetical protein VG013_10640 [Gemmataceae bacterium]|jgi:hypothetical protein|nr:hypothetical protein [Gemmataceae bacterium]
MSLTEETIDGTLQADGTLALDHAPQLPPGRVRVIVQVPVPARQRGLADAIADIRASQQARGFQGRTAAEMQADEAARQADEDEYERQMQTLWSQTRSGPPKGNP